MIAARQGDLPMVQLLLDRGADTTLRDYTGRSAMMWAEWNNRKLVVQLFRKAKVRE